MKFAHMADSHIGGWRDQTLSQLNLQVFSEAIESCIKSRVDFILISGDLFNSALPGIDQLKTVVQKLRGAKDANVRVYVVPGSHDFSPSGKSILDVLETAKLLVNVVRGDVRDDKLNLSFTLDKSGAKITGMLGKRGGLEKAYYQDLDRTSLEQEEGFKIFMLHSALDELKSVDMTSAPLSLLPKGFDYYAAGHVHERIVKNIEGYGLIVYPGPLFPNNFKEMEELKGGGYYLFDSTKKDPVYVAVGEYNVQSIVVDLNSVQEIEQRLKRFSENEFYNTIVTLRIRGTIEGKTSDIGYREIIDKIISKGAIAVLRNTAGLASKEFEEVTVNKDSTEEIEAAVIKEHTLKTDLTETLIKTLDKEKQDGERVVEFEERVIKDTDSVLMRNLPVVISKHFKDDG